MYFILVKTNFKKMQKYNKYIEYIKNAFKNSYERAGGENYRFYHSFSVANTAYQIAKSLKLSDIEVDIVVLASLFHDIGKIERIQKNGLLESSRKYEIENNLERHEDISARMVYSILKNDFALDIIDTIASIIKDDMQDNILANILHDADNISELGFINICRLFTYNYNKSIEFVENYYMTEDKKKKENKLPTLHFDISRNLAKERLNKTYDFLVELKKEIGLE